MDIDTKNTAKTSLVSIQDEEVKKKFMERMIKRVGERTRKRFSDPAMYVAREGVTEKQREDARRAQEVLLEFRKNRKWETGPISPSSLETKGKQSSIADPTVNSDRKTDSSTH